MNCLVLWSISAGIGWWYAGMNAPGPVQIQEVLENRVDICIAESSALASVPGHFYYRGSDPVLDRGRNRRTGQGMR